MGSSNEVSNRTITMLSEKVPTQPRGSCPRAKSIYSRPNSATTNLQLKYISWVMLRCFIRTHYKMCAKEAGVIRRQMTLLWIFCRVPSKTHDVEPDKHMNIFLDEDKFKSIFKRILESAEFIAAILDVPLCWFLFQTLSFLQVSNMVSFHPHSPPTRHHISLIILLLYPTVIY